uniref:EB domain-containing protein n=1 Tax=Heterorhabditis bacteriophora TaxID=37862 RepID=A0A1I7X0B9_HETBA
MCVSLDSQADPGQMCEEDVTVCTGNSQCLNEICTCASGQISLNGQCVHIISQVTTSPIRGCSMNYECGINSMCIQGRCQCNKGFSFINGHCLSQCTSQCDPNATCQEGSCRCRNGFISSGSSCIPLHNHILEPNPYSEVTHDVPQLIITYLYFSLIVTLFSANTNGALADAVILTQTMTNDGK